MSTRGFITFVVDGQEKTAYNHFDSYPDGLGAAMLTWLRDAGDIREQAAALRVVTDATPPTEQDRERLRPYANQEVGRQSPDDWYCLLRETQGNPALMLKAGVIEDASGFPMDSLYAEYGYVVDLDAGKFEVYRGFQTAPHDSGRFASRPPAEHSVGDYYPVALMASWPLAELPDDAAFSAATTERDEDDQ